MGISADEVVVQASDQGRGVQLYELGPQDLAHLGGVGGVAPIRVVHSGECHAFSFADDGGHLHVC